MNTPRSIIHAACSAAASTLFPLAAAAEPVPQTLDDNARSVADATASLAVAALRSSRDDRGNTVLSPWSIDAAMGMVSQGADGKCAEQIAKSLSFPAKSEDAASGFHSLIVAFGEAARGGQGEKDKRSGLFEFTNADRLWVSRGVKLKDPFTLTMTSSFGADFKTLNSDSPDKAAKEINGWVSDKTKKRITQLVSAADIPPRGVVLTNAVYFKADWPVPFDTKSTRDKEFTLPDGSTIKTPTMHDDGMYPYAEGDGFQALSLAYRGPFHMLIVLPEKDKLPHVLTTIDLAKIKPVATGRKVFLAFPKFDAKSHMSVVSLLKGMGITDAFDPALADFTGMTDDKPTYINNVIHAASVKVDEKGTEAAAATAVMMSVAASLPGRKPDPIYFTIDRPFLFFIRHDASGAVLFAGVIRDPRK